MTYKFIGYGTNTLYSSIKYIWQDINTKKYYISCDPQNEIKSNNVVDDCYMLIREPKKPPELSEYRDYLTDAKELSYYDILNREVFYGGASWKFNKCNFNEVTREKGLFA